jgi:hypothetical protein
VENWRWSILGRPGIRTEDVFVLESDGKVSAYAVLSEDGGVLDFVVDPDLRGGTRRAYIKELVQALEDRARSRDCDALMFSLPASDRLVDRTLREAGYVAERSDFYSIGILNPRVLLQELLTARHARLRSLRLATCTLELTPGQYPFLLMRRLLVRLQPTVQVEDRSDAVECPSDATIRIDLSSLTELMFCRVSVDALLAGSQLQIEPATSVADVREVLHALVVDADWHLPPYDGF